MQLQDLTMQRKRFAQKKLQFFSDLYSKAIWGDMGEDCASIYLSATTDAWHLHFIRTQSGEPYPLSETVCNIVDEYEKDLNDNEAFDFLLLHHKMKEFEEFCSSN